MDIAISLLTTRERLDMTNGFDYVPFPPIT